MRTSVFKLTQDDWHGSYKLDSWHKGQENPMLVNVSFMPLTDGKWRVCVWGNDDCGMERDFPEEKTAWNMFLQILDWEFVSMHQLNQNEFVAA